MSFDGIAAVDFHGLFPFDDSRAPRPVGQSLKQKSSSLSEERVEELEEEEEEFNEDELLIGSEEEYSEGEELTELNGDHEKRQSEPKAAADYLNDKETTEALQQQAEERKNAVISQFDIRGQKGRRLTFIMQEVPDVLVKGKGDKFIEELRHLIGFDIFSEKDESDDERWSPKELGDGMTKVGAASSEKDLDDSLTQELLSANDETDALYNLDSLSGETFGDIAKRKKSIKKEEAVSQEMPCDAPEILRIAQRTSTMDILQLKLWFMHVRNSYKSSIKIIKVSLKGQKYVRAIEVGEEGHAPRRCHLSAIKSVKLGFVSDAFRNLLDVTPENQPVPPPQNCVVVVLPNHSVSIILPSEQARNEFLLLMRVLVRQAKRLYGDNSFMGTHFSNDIL